MKLFYIIKNGLLRRLKDYKNLGFMVVFPVFLTFIFITVFGNLDVGFKDGGQQIEVIKIGIWSQAEAEFNDSYLTFLDQVSKERKGSLTYQIEENYEKQVAALQSGAIDVFVNIDTNHLITLQHEENGENKAQVVRGITKAFLENKALSETFVKNDTDGQKDSPVNEINYDATRLPKTHKNFYVLSIAATMIAFTVLMAGSYGCASMHYIHQSVGKRVQSAPLSKNILYLGEYITGVILAFIQGCIMVISSELVFNIGFRMNPVQIAVIMGLLSMMAVALGACIGTLFQDEKVSSGMVSVAIMILCFSSGGFNPNMDFGRLTEFSPITVVNTGIIDICTKQSAENLVQIILIALGFTLICLGIAAVRINIYKREAN